MNLKQRIVKEAEEAFEKITQYRRHLHAHPELSFEEYQTSDFIADRLQEMGITPIRGWVNTGITAFIEGKKPESSLVALRADMDALPIQEETPLEYASAIPGKMHACGHDVHMASLLGTAYIIQQLRDRFEGTVQLIFQPGEEKLPGGALLMIREGIFNNRRPDLIIGQHVLPTMDAGCVGFRPGVYMASSDELYFKVKGKGGHGAMPQDLIDPVPVAAKIILALQEITSRKAGPGRPTVLSIGKVQANGATNVIPDEVYMEGTFRTMDEQWRKDAHQWIRMIAGHTAEALGARCECTIEEGYPVLVNDPSSTRHAEEAAIQLLGKENVIPQDLRMTAEDFAFFTQDYPAVFYRLGVRKKNSTQSFSLHSSTFEVDEKALLTGMSTMAWLALHFLENKNNR